MLLMCNMSEILLEDHLLYMSPSFSMYPSAIVAACASAGIGPVQLILRVVLAPCVRAPGLVHKRRWPHLGLAMYAYTKH